MKEDLEFARRTKEDYKRHERGEFIQMDFDEFIEEMNSFEGLISYFVSACLALRRKTKTLARKIECPSVLEFTCLEATYNF